MNETRSGELIQRYFLGTISESDATELDRRLRDDPAVRAEFAAMARLDTNLRDAASSVPNTNRGPGERPLGARFGILFGLGAAAALMLAVLLFSQFRPETPGHANAPVRAPVARIADLNGSVTWIGDGGRVDQSPQVGDELTGGSLEVLSLDSWAEIVFADGSSVWVSGPAGLTLSDGAAGKLIRLREGDLSLQVSPQPTGKPLRLITPSAEAVVLGTQFNVTANPASTSLTVNEGRVRVTRLADGSVQEVAANHRVVAALEQKTKFRALPRSSHVRTWKSEFPRDVRQGQWKPGAGDGPGSLRAEAHLFRGDHGEQVDPILLHTAVAGPANGSLPPVLLTEGARFRIHGRLEHSYRVSFGFGTHRAAGGFSGKYATEREINVDPGTGGRFELELGLDEFPRRASRFPGSPTDDELVWFWIQTLEKDVGLEVFHIELLASEPPATR
jgi:ferric-dicitrate binding protein FerR (iron transport regulator)